MLYGLQLAGINSVFLAKALRDLAADRQKLRVLDIGSGNGTPWQMTALYAGEVNVDLTTIDAFKPNSTQHGFSGFKGQGKMKRLWGDALDVLAKLESNSFDLVIALDIIEHLSKVDGYRLLYEMNRVSKRGIGLSCPNGFSWQPPSPLNPFQAHISSWEAKEFRQMGFAVKPYNGLRATSKPFGQKKYPVNFATGPWFLFENILARIFPSQSSNIWAVRIGKLPTFDELGSTASERFLRQVDPSYKPLDSENY